MFSGSDKPRKADYKISSSLTFPSWHMNRGKFRNKGGRAKIWLNREKLTTYSTVSLRSLYPFYSSRKLQYCMSEKTGHFLKYTECPRSCDPIHLVTYNMKWVKTSRTHSNWESLLRNIDKIINFYSVGKLNNATLVHETETFSPILPRLLFCAKNKKSAAYRRRQFSSSAKSAKAWTKTSQFLRKRNRKAWEKNFPPLQTNSFSFLYYLSRFLFPSTIITLFTFLHYSLSKK